MPNSSAVTAKMKSVWLSGRMRFTVPSPGPCPASRPARSSRWRCRPGTCRPMRGRGSGRCAPRRAAAACRRRRCPARRAPPRPSTQNQCSPDMKKSPPQTMRDQHGLADIGLQHQRNDRRRAAAGSRGCCRARRVRRPPSENGQAARTTKAGFRNSEGWRRCPQISSAARPSPRRRRTASPASAPCDDIDEQRGAPDMARARRS